MRTNLTTWGALLLLTSASFWARRTLHGPDAAGLILAAAGIKCSTLGWQFMELRRAHWLWRVALLGLLVALLGGLVGVLARGPG